MTIARRDIVSKKILTEAKGYLDVGFTHSLNPYSGCAFACAYCYVREMPLQKFKETPWGEWLDVKTNAVENYRTEIASLRRRQKPVRIFLSSATDPYQPAEREAKLTRSILEEMVVRPPDALQIQTRAPLVARDIDVLSQLKAKCNVVVSMTIETDREDMKRLFAPKAPGIGLRIKALREVHEAGIFTQAAISPVLPYTPDFPKRLEGIADRIWIDTLHIGDGAMGKRSARLGMPGLFESRDLAGWYRPDLHLLVEKQFKEALPEAIVRVSKEEAYPFDS
ncbi:SPL family radical SAM protein [Paenibacillus sp.]|uniref:SPL family radical SAM protein n=1 Tax=Paenibacillus sp. TaxID=58172 RepID=UPI002D704C64|nr:radical SAM protein [Paenibacillus sp.]HZG56466.1 radical SAM protein [Paenibacillus sp.]